ncbi:MAG TPA: DEAD/DEAH box helicase, partial [Nannocystaceae bacterium]|nr:DEAD/DEAH box helicase [Nannocystaceae bacterium]
MFGPATKAWFERSFAAPTAVQSRGWASIAEGAHSLLVAPTGSGKTLAAFLWCIDRLVHTPPATPGVRVLYVSPLKALVYDVERNLRAPLFGIAQAAEGLGLAHAMPRVAVRTGDTTTKERVAQAKDPADILVTTPESLFLMLASRVRETLTSVDTIIVDEVHAIAPSKRGAHLALSLERLVALTGREPQRIGLSATARPLDEVARFLGGDRAVTIIDCGGTPKMEVSIVVPVPDMTRPEVVPSPELRAPPAKPAKKRSSSVLAPAPPGLGEPVDHSIWPAVYPRLLELIAGARTTIVFVNSRGLCERLAQRLNELADAPLVRAHHGSLAHAQRTEIEESLKRGDIRGIVA